MKCLWRGGLFEYHDPGMYPFCDRRLGNLETPGIDLGKAERKLRKRM